MLMPSIFGEKLFDDFFNDFTRPTFKAKAFPATGVMKTDIKENENGYELKIELPGYKKEDVKAQLKDGYMTITASTNQNNDQKDENGRYIRRERYVGSSSRSFYVGEAITEDDIKAGFEDGILNIYVPKKQPQPKIEEQKYITIE